MTKLQGRGTPRKGLDSNPRVKEYDEAFMDGGFMVTLAHGWAFYDAAANVGDDPEGASACHCSGFETQREALAAITTAKPCRCGRCLPNEQQYVEAEQELEFLPRLDDSTQYSTIYAGGRPVGTLQRRRVMERTGPVWTLYATDGALVRKWLFRPSYRALAKGAKMALSRAGIIRSEVR